MHNMAKTDEDYPRHQLDKKRENVRISEEKNIDYLENKMQFVAEALEFCSNICL